MTRKSYIDSLYGIRLFGFGADVYALEHFDEIESLETSCERRWYIRENNVKLVVEITQVRDVDDERYFYRQRFLKEIFYKNWSVLSYELNLIGANSYDNESYNFNNYLALRGGEIKLKIKN